MQDFIDVRRLLQLIQLHDGGVEGIVVAHQGPIDRAEQLVVAAHRGDFVRAVQGDFPEIFDGADHDIDRVGGLPDPSGWAPGP